ncbi:retrovirus-related pol polyprotein from transposon TNT 1-94 [Tanacetum coccineum]
MKPKAGIGIFIGYSKSSREFRIYNRRTTKIMETIHVKFDELTAMASECNNSGPGINCLNFQDSLEDSNTIPSKEELNNLFGPLYEEYYEARTPKVPDNSAANTLDNEETPSSSLIIVDEHEAPQLVSSSEEPSTNEQTTPVSTDNADESVQEDVAEFDGNPFHTLVVEEAESSFMFQDLSNMHEFHQNIALWTKNHPTEQVICDPSKPVMTRHRLHTDTKMYVKTTFLNGPLKEVYVSQSDGFVDPKFPNHMYRFKKAMYGLKQALRAWYDKLSSFLIEHHFTKGIVDLALFTRRHGDDILLVQIYVDDIIFGSTNPVFSNRFAKLMKDNLEMSMMGEMKFFLRLQCTPMANARIDADLQGTPTDQTKYQSMIGRLMYLTASRPDIAFATFVSMSTVEAEYVSLSACYAKVIWMGTQLLDYGYRYTKIPMYYDSKNAISISYNPVQHSRTKHINIRYHFIKEHVEQGTIELYFVETKYQLADLFTKAFLKERFEYLVHRIGMRCMTPTELDLAKLSS